MEVYGCTLGGGIGGSGKLFVLRKKGLSVVVVPYLSCCSIGRDSVGNPRCGWCRIWMLWRVTRRVMGYIFVVGARKGEKTSEGEVLLAVMCVLYAVCHPIREDRDGIRLIIYKSTKLDADKGSVFS